MQAAQVQVQEAGPVVEQVQAPEAAVVGRVQGDAWCVVVRSGGGDQLLAMLS